MITVDTVRMQHQIELRTLKELAEARDVLERLGYDISVNPDDYHQWNRVRARHEEQLHKVAELEAELMKYGNR